MRIRMNTSMPVTVDGVNTRDLDEGDELTVGDGVGADLVAEGHADSLEPEYKDAGAADENKDAADDELLTHTRAELNEMAAEFGIENAEDLPNKQAVADAITAAK